MLNPQKLHKLFEESGALLEGHFLLSSGLHSPKYLQCALLLQDPARAELAGQALGEQFAGQQLDFVVGPAMGALIIGHEVARATRSRFLFTERDAQGKAVLRRGFFVLPGERCVVVEDVITTGGSTREVIELLHQAGAEIRAVACIVDRSGGRANFGGIPLVSLMQLDVPAWPAAECELCAKGVPVEKPGSRK